MIDYVCMVIEKGAEAKSVRLAASDRTDAYRQLRAFFPGASLGCSPAEPFAPTLTAEQREITR